MTKDVATTTITTEKVLRLHKESKDILWQAYSILDQISEEWNEDFPEFRQAYEALEEITSHDEFRIKLQEGTA